MLPLLFPLLRACLRVAYCLLPVAFNGIAIHEQLRSEAGQLKSLIAQTEIDRRIGGAKARNRQCPRRDNSKGNLIDLFITNTVYEFI